MTLKGKNVLITGGCGSIGFEIAKQLVDVAKTVRIFDINENGLFNAQQYFKDRDNVRYLLGDVRDKRRVKRAMDNVDVVFHCAALKHVWICEYNPFEAVRTNIDGLQNAVDAAMDEEIERFVFTSTDKAANPSSLMGTTKLVGERLVTSANYYKGNRKTVFASMRFGNVLGSSGSVVPLFKKQILEGGPVTLTHEEMRRFMISTKQAIGLVFKATEIAKGGEVFILKMDSLKIKDLAEAMIEGMGKKGIKIQNIGVKAGEKLYEELMTPEESTRALETDDMFIILPQLKELVDGKNAGYSDAKKTKLKSYSVKDTKLLPKGEIKDLLKKENLL